MLKKFRFLILICIFELGLSQVKFDSISAWNFNKVLTSEKFQGRKSGTPAGEKASEWIAEKFKEFGLKPFGDNGTYFQNFKILATQDKVSKLTLINGRKGKTKYSLGDDFTILTNSGSGKVKSKVVFVGYGISAPEKGRDDYANVDVKGKIVIVVAGTPPDEEGKVVECEVDGKRREILRRHHTATHILNYSSRKVLGKHVWQYGAEKSVEKARLDITHFQALSEEEIEKIEKIANEIVDKDFKVKIEVLPRGEAEKKYGFIIYQGGPLNEKNVRIVSFGEEHEACGGLHCFSTKEVGPIIILRTKRIADGIVRIEFCSGEVSLNYLKESEKTLEEI
ncbi:Threonyl and Alanyl tRNA synthetase second additional domain-containing protein, partial [Candidatus Kryptobacter tengchongensis]